MIRDAELIAFALVVALQPGNALHFPAGAIRD